MAKHQKTTPITPVTPVTQPDPVEDFEQEDQSQAAAAPEPELKPQLVPELETKVVSVENVLSLKRQWESQREDAIKELLKQKRLIESQLKELGFTPEPDFLPVPASSVQPFRSAEVKPMKRTKSARGGKPISSGTVCPICTVDPNNPVTGHDGRLHRGQGKRKRPFTKAEVAERGL